MNRRHDLDWVRVCAFALLVLFHVGMYYVSWDWHVKSPHAGRALEPLMLLTAPWRLSLLFLVSGAATAFMLGKTAIGLFVRERNRRLLIPLAFGAVVIVPPQAYYEVVEKFHYAGGYAEFWLRYMRADGTFCRDGACLILPTWNHLWFLAYVWAYTLALCAVLAWAPRAAAGVQARVAATLSSRAGLLVWPIVLLAAARVGLVDRFGSTHALVDDWYNHARYLPCFLIGFVLAREDAPWDRMRVLRWPAVGLALSAWAFLAWHSASAAGDPPASPPWLLHVLWATNQWSATVALLGFARALAPGDSRALRYLAPAVLPVYLLHQTFIVVFARWLQPAALAPAVEGPLLVVLTLAACFACYEAVRRLNGLRPLFGLKRLSAPPAARLSAAAARSGG